MSSKKKSSELSHTRTRAGRRLCDAKGNTCRAFAVVGSSKCYHHGGKSTGAPLKHGRYSKYLPENLLKSFEEYQEDEKLSDLKDDVALLTSMIADELDGAKNGAPSLELWKEANALYGKAMDGGPQGPNAIKELGHVLKDGQARTEKIYRAATLLDQRRKLVETEQKLELQSERNLTIAQAMAFTMALAAGAREEIQNAKDIEAKAKEKLQRAIAFKIARLVRRSLGPGADAGLAGD